MHIENKEIIIVRLNLFSIGKVNELHKTIQNCDVLDSKVGECAQLTISTLLVELYIEDMTASKTMSF